MRPDVRTILAVIFCLALFALPWLNGGNLPGVRTFILFWVILGSIICFFRSNLIGTPTSLGLLFSSTLWAAIIYSSVQLIPLGETTLSQYPAATREQLAVLILAVGIFHLASCIFSNPQKLHWLFGSIALNGVLLTWFGLAQAVSGTDRMYWTYELAFGGQMFGPYVNSNNAGGYLLMCFAAANFFLALIGFRSMQDSSGPRGEDETLLGRAWSAVGSSIANANVWDMYTLLAVAVTAAGVFATLSRGAAVALVVAMFAGWGMLFRRNLSFVIVLLVVVGSAVGLLGWSQRNEVIATNIESFSDAETMETRLAHWQDGWNYAVDYLPLGSGLGTYNLMYLPYQQRPFLRWFKYAENQYLQTLAELGIPGLLALLSLVGMALLACIRLASKPDRTSRSLGVAGIMALLSQFVAAGFDFGLYQPANMCLLATIMGAVFGQLNWCWSATNVGARPPLGRILLARFALGIMAIGAIWAAIEYSAVDARESCRRFYRQFDPMSNDRQAISFYRQLANHAVRIRNDDAQAHFQLALTHVLDYRIAASETMVEEMLRPNENVANGQQNSSESTGEAIPVVDPEFTFEQAWPRSTLTFLHRLSRLAAYEGDAELNLLRESKPIKQHLNLAWQHMVLAEKACNKFWNIPLGLGQLSQLMDNSKVSQEEAIEKEQFFIDQAVERSRNNPDVLLVAGMIKHHSGFTESACDLWNKCLQQTIEFELPILQICLGEISLKDFFERVLPDDPKYRLRLAKKYFALKENSLIRKLLLDHTKAKVLEAEIPESERQYWLGEIARIGEDYVAAIDHFRRALDQESNQVLWRIQLARALIEANLFEQALAELKVCEFHPGNHHIQCRKLQKVAKRRRIARLRDGTQINQSLNE